jgi:hypothetical protein
MTEAKGLDDRARITLTHHGKSHSFDLLSDAAVTQLSEDIAERLSVPVANQKLMVSKLGLLRFPFDKTGWRLSDLVGKKITLLGSTEAEVASVKDASDEAASALTRRQARTPKAKAYKTHDWKREEEEARYTFLTLRPLAYLPQPERSLAFLQRLKDDAGIQAAMRRHWFTVPLLTEMNPADHTTLSYDGSGSRTLGLNRNRGEVIELRLRTDAYDGYRDYKTIRATLCHELAHNVHSPHDRQFWDLCRQIEDEVARDDWTTTGRSLGGADAHYAPTAEDEVDDHGGWTGGDFVLGIGADASAATAGGTPVGTAMSRREILARAAEARASRQQGQDRRGGASDEGR